MEAAGWISIRGVATTATGVYAAATGTQARAAPTAAMRALQGVTMTLILSSLAHPRVRLSRCEDKALVCTIDS